MRDGCFGSEDAPNQAAQLGVRVQGSIAQIVALTTYGNAFLRGLTEFNESFYPANSTFKFCERIEFVGMQPDGEKWKEALLAADPIAWLEVIRSDGVTGLQMSYGPSGAKESSDRMMVGFVGGGGRWRIEAIGSRSSDWWSGRWQIGDRDRKDQRIWRVTYGRFAEGQPQRGQHTEDLARLRGELERCLGEIAEFAHAQQFGEFAKAFESGLARLRSELPYNDLYHTDIAPLQLLPLSARQLLGASQAAWVFGGMGSWNDVVVGRESQGRYDELSERLYALLNRAIVAAANSSMAPMPPKKRSWKFWN